MDAQRIFIFKAFFWKNWLYILHNKYLLIANFLLWITVTWIFLHSTYQLKFGNLLVGENRPSDYFINNFPSNLDDLLAYAPKTEFSDLLMNRVRKNLQIPIELVKGFESENEMISEVENNCKGTCFAVHFRQIPKTNESGNLDFSISSNIIKISPNKQYVNDEQVSEFKENDEYMATGFLILQHLITKNFINNRTTSTNNFSNYDVEILPMPLIEQKIFDGERLINFGSLYALLFNALLLSTYLVPLVEEKQDGLKEFLVIATPFNYLNGLTFFLLRLIAYSICTGIILSIAWQYDAFGNASSIYIVILYVLYILSAMSYTYLISVCFKSVFYAKVGGWLLLVAPYMFCLVDGRFFQITTGLFSLKSFMEGIKSFQIFSNKYNPLSFGDITTNITDSSWSILSIYIILIFQCIIYAILYWYFSKVFPGPGGLKKSYLFFIKDWFTKRQNSAEYDLNSCGPDAIIIQDLVKHFHTPARTINIADHLNMNIKNKQITVLLGHNGAGKTTTLNMIIGSEPIDSGRITVCSERDVFAYRHLIGICPQHSIFMSYMTCSQHLQFFALLRGDPFSQAKIVADKLLQQLNLQSKANEYGKNLSGGMKRRLSLGIALSGNTKIIILDEPSSGLDIESRRELWDILLKLRKEKAILVTTHHMEEAEVLGDTIFILGNGTIQNSGTPLDLKRRVGSGYILKLNANAGSYDERKTLDLIKEFIPSAGILDYVKPTVLISLPYHYKDKYSVLLNALEKEQSQLGITSISVTDTSLEDVFLKCADEIDQVDSVSKQSSQIEYQPLDRPVNISSCRQFKAILYKKQIFLKNEWKYFLLMISLPLISVGLAFYLMNASPDVINGDELLLSSASFKGGTIYVHNSVGDALSQRIESLLREKIKSCGLSVGRFDNVQWSLTNALLELQRNDYPYFLQNVIGLIEIGRTDDGSIKFVLHFSVNVYHDSVILLNLVENVFLTAATNRTDAVNVIYKPIRRFIIDVSPSRLEYFAAIVPIGVFFYMFFYVSLPFRENSSGFKMLQAIPRHKYWSYTFLIDAFMHCIVCILLFTLMRLTMSDKFYSTSYKSTIAISIFFYGLSYLPILYCFANGLRSISTISTYLLFILVISATAPLITSGSLQAMKSYQTAILILSTLPDFNLNHQLRVVNENFMLSRHQGATTRQNVGGVPSTGAFYYDALATMFVSFMILISIVENKDRREAINEYRQCNCVKVNNCETDEPETESFVRQEKECVEKILKEKSASQYPMVVSNLHKRYGRCAAVRGVDFAVRERECFGLLGVNGAGKTSTFQMITTNIKINRGNIQIEGVDILTNEDDYKRLFGYCPQHDCLNKFMTAHQTLTYMAKLRGVDERREHEEVLYWLEKFDLLKYRSVQVRHYSGGTKRKLNAAIAMIGSPSIALLDEPTTGVDPVSKRFLWKSIQEFQNRGKTVVLTSHSLDECEKLCNRLAIMANGKIKCLGEVPDLKQRYGSGFTIKLKLKSDDPNELDIQRISSEIEKHFQGRELREHHAGILTYFIKHTNPILWSTVFSGCEKLMSACENFIEMYSVNETTLEDIFLRCDTYDGGVRQDNNHQNNISVMCEV